MKKTNEEELKKVIRDNCKVASVPKEATAVNDGKQTKVKVRAWEITDIKLDPIIEGIEKILRPVKKNFKKTDGGE